MPDYGIRLLGLGQPTIWIQNIGNEVLKFVHTDDCESDVDCCVSRISDEWLEGPPKVGKFINPDTWFKVGKLDTTFWGHDHQIFLTYEMHTHIVLFVSVMTYNGGSVRVLVDRYLPSESWHHGRAELVHIDSENATINIQIPSAGYWLAATAANEAYDGSRDDGTEDIMLAGKIIDTVLGTLITTCFVVPGMGGLAVGFTLLEGILNLALSPAAEKQRMTLTQFKVLLESNNKLFQQQHFNSLQSAMEKAANSFAEENFGINKTFHDICACIDSQKDKSTFDDNLKSSIEGCLKDLVQVVAHQSEFQKALDQCMGVMSKASDAGENPSKIRLAVIFAATSMTMNAYALITALKGLITAESSGWQISATPLMSSLDDFSPTEILKWMFATKRRIASWNTKENAKVNRFGHVCMEVDNFTEMKAPHARLIVYDSAIGLASWGPGSEHDAGDRLRQVKDGFKRDEPNWYDKVPSWTYKELPLANREKHKINYNTPRRVGEEYKRYLDNLIENEYEMLVEKSLGELEESGTPYFALLGKPYPPQDDREIQQVTIDDSQTFVSMTELKLRYVQYGYSFANSAGVESTTLWQTRTIKIEPKAGMDSSGATFIYPTGARLTVPVDPWNEKAKSFAVKANEIANKTDPSHKLIPPPYSSSTRIIYRRLCSTEKKEEWTDTTSQEDKIGSLDNSSDNSFSDNWVESLRSM